MKIQLERLENFTVNSVFTFDESDISSVLDSNDNVLKYAFYPDKQKLVVFGDHKTVFVVNEISKVQVYAGKSGSGKTISLMCDALNNCVTNGNVLYMSTELNHQFILNRVLKLAKNLNINKPSFDQFIIDQYSINNLHSWIKSNNIKYIYIDNLVNYQLNEINDFKKLLKLAYTNNIQIFAGLSINHDSHIENANILKSFNKYEFLELYATVEKCSDFQSLTINYTQTGKCDAINIKDILK